VLDFTPFVVLPRLRILGASFLFGFIKLVGIERWWCEWKYLVTLSLQG